MWRYPTSSITPPKLQPGWEKLVVAFHTWDQVNDYDLKIVVTIANTQPDFGHLDSPMFLHVFSDEEIRLEVKPEQRQCTGNEIGTEEDSFHYVWTLEAANSFEEEEDKLVISSPW